ncbi:hypothetical protein EJB05_01872, partial [Eragrostis curvula]
MVDFSFPGEGPKAIYSIEEIYRIKLPGKPTDIGEWKPEIQNHAIIFTRGEALQSININQLSTLTTL